MSSRSPTKTRKSSFKSTPENKEDKQGGTPLANPLQGADHPQGVCLFITSCHPDTDEEDIKDFLENKFRNISSVKAFKTKITHKYYSSFALTIRGKDINLDLFLRVRRLS